ncbi:Aste57867_14304 [Aphanomyces stellatus]|uniref:Aste57867_14304 protein n=1 Tax=Aphanomyces stellatus TaxID=120398 RepID=A0A485L0A5_9STRA|nr:hypothetical protein As57867_014251 [Aphanomyces stellatus]VFT91129.1 Aste57867_14304 [Aphanomyces stellatus]
MAKHGNKKRLAAVHPPKSKKNSKTEDVKPVKKKPVGKVKANGPSSLNLNARIDASVSSAFHQANLSNPNPKSVGGVSDKHRVLVVGDGDFSFSLALATRLGGQRITATVYDSEADLLEKYPNVSANIRGLQITQAQIHIGVDATNLAKEKWIRKETFDRVVFNFPHLGGATEEDVEKNQDLLFRFFQSARPFDDAKGEVHVALRNTPFYNRWDVAAQAQKAGFKAKRVDRFNISEYPGYEAQRTHPASFRGEPPSTEGARTHVFSKDLAFVEAAEAAPVAAAKDMSKKKRPVGKEEKEKPKSWKCVPCGMTFNLESKYNGHSNSAKHAKVVKALKKKK